MAIDFTRQLVARWPQPETSHLALLKEAGIQAVVCDSPGPAFASAAAAAGIAIASEAELAAAGAVVTRGVWPGIRRPGRRLTWDNNLVATASAEPWIDSNAYLVPLERALSADGRAPIIAFEAGPKTGLPPDRSVPFSTLEAALIETRVQGGNYILSLDPRYRQALLLGQDAAARSAWTSLGRTAAWLEANQRFWGLAAPATITALVEPGEASAEIANLLFRRNGSPRLVNATRLPPPDPGSIQVLVAASLNNVPDGIWKHAAAGSTVVIDNPALIPSTGWRSARKEADREFFSAPSGQGQIVAYRKRVADPSEFALDVIDLVGHRRRTARHWNARSAIVFSTAGPAPGEALLHMVNYGSPVKEDVQARIAGHYGSATLLRPQGPPVTLKTAPRGLATEVFLPGLEQIATVHYR